MKRGQQNLWKLIWSYFVVGALPIIVLSVLISSILFNRLKKDVENLNIDIMEQIQKRLDRNFALFFSLANQSADNEDIMNFLNQKQEHTAQTISLYYDIRKVMERYSSNERLFVDTAVYSSVNDIIIGKGGLKTPSEYYECYLNENDIFDEEVFHNSLKDGSRRNFFYSNDDYIVCGQSLELNRYIDKGVFLVLMEKDAIVQQVQDMNPDVNFMIMNNNSVIFQSGGDELSEELYEYLKEPVLSEEGFEIGGQTILCRKSTSVGNFQYVYFYKQKMLSRNIYNVSKIFLCGIFVAALLALLLASRNGRRTKSVIERLTDANRLIEENLLEQIENTREHLLRNILQSIPSEETFERLLEYNIRFIRKHICVLAMELYNVDEDNISGSDVWMEVNKDVLTYFRLQNIDCYPVKIDSTNMRYILCYDNEDLHLLYEKLLHSLLGDYQIIFALGVGREISSAEDLYWSAESAMYALYQSVHKNGQPIYYDVVCQNIPYSNQYYTLESEKQLIQNMRNGNVYGISLFFDKLYQELFGGRFFPIHIMQSLLISLEATIYRTLDLLYFDNKRKYENFDRICKKVLSGNNFEDSFQIFREICISISKEMGSTTEKDNVKIQIEEFVNNNYQNYEISLEVLANYIGINYYSLSHAFKDYMGMNFVSYVTMVRMQKAVNMLINTNFTVQQIAESVGFAGSSSFIKVFKKYYGVTPKKYREDSQNGEVKK